MRLLGLFLGMISFTIVELLGQVASVGGASTSKMDAGQFNWAAVNNHLDMSCGQWKDYEPKHPGDRTSDIGITLNSLRCPWPSLHFHTHGSNPAHFPSLKICFSQVRRYSIEEVSKKIYLPGSRYPHWGKAEAEAPIIQGNIRHAKQAMVMWSIYVRAG